MGLIYAANPGSGYENKKSRVYEQQQRQTPRTDERIQLQVGGHTHDLFGKAHRTGEPS